MNKQDVFAAVLEKYKDTTERNNNYKEGYAPINHFRGNDLNNQQNKNDNRVYQDWLNETSGPDGVKM